jgi:FkbM family methyltransferase
VNDVERCTWNCIRGLMLSLDPDRSGWAIDAGVGHFDFYCEWMRQLGYPTLAIEPVIDPDVVEMCSRQGIVLVEAALGDLDGTATLYSASDRDLRSLDGNLWGGMTPVEAVVSVTLPTLLGQHGIERVTALKLDIEGGEPAALSRLPDLAADQLPLVISFEWGGEWPAKTGRGPWQPAQQRRIKETFQMLDRLGYKRGLVIGSGGTSILRLIDEGSMPWLFEPDDNWGNAVLTRGSVGVDTLVEYMQSEGETNG